MNDRGLNAVAIQKLALDLRCLDGLIAHQLDLEPILVGVGDVLAGADEFAGAERELPLEGRQRRRIAAEIRPIRLLPVPPHELWQSFL
jgi:hypothetical protein